MVIGMPFEMKQHKIGEYVVAVPRMMRMAAFVFAVRALQAQQPIVLYVVGACELPIRENMMHQQKCDHFPAKRNNKNDCNCQG